MYNSKKRMWNFMKDVFISYNSPKYEVAETIMKYLENNGITCFLDKRDIPAGHDWVEALMEGIENCYMVIFLYSNDANENSKNVLSEVAKAWESDTPCITLLLDDSKPSRKIDYYTAGFQRVTCYPMSIDTYLPTIVEAVKGMLPEKEAVVEEEEAVPVTKFDYDPKIGRMINPKDGEPNVSFRVDTFINMMGGIYEKVAEIAKSDETAQEIFFESGYASGENFANRINSKWGNGFSIEEIQKKINKWCEFDSVVGWGKFEADINFDEENDVFEGTLTITEAFIVDTKHKRKVCAFIRGYCTGVLNALLGDLDVELTCRSCPLEKKLSRKCVFDVKMKG